MPEYISATSLEILKKNNKEMRSFMAILGNPFVANVPKQLSSGEIAQALRVDIAGELEAIIGYEAHATATTDDRVKKVLYHIADEERRHVGELQELLYLISPKERQFIEAGRMEINKQQSTNFQTPMQ
jgi:rubrerythrin